MSYVTIREVVDAVDVVRQSLRVGKVFELSYVEFCVRRVVEVDSACGSCRAAAAATVRGETALWGGSPLVISTQFALRNATRPSSGFHSHLVRYGS